MNLILAAKATVFASKKHEGQFRKYTGMPYIVHPMEVAKLVREKLAFQVGDYLDCAVAAAILHDTIEDTDTTYNDLLLEFGIPVANLVDMVSKVSKPEDGNRAIRKAIDLKHYAKGTFTSQTIKLADIWCNSTDMFRENKEYAKKYLPENLELTKALTRTDEDFRDRVQSRLENLLLLL